MGFINVINVRQGFEDLNGAFRRIEPGDTPADTTAVLQAALDVAAAIHIAALPLNERRNAATIYLPQGTYEIDATLRIIRERVTITGDKRARTIIRAAAGFVGDALIEGVRDCEIRNVSLQRDPAAGVIESAVLIDCVNDGAVHSETHLYNVDIIDFDHGLSICAWQCVVENIEITDCRIGVRWHGGTSATMTNVFVRNAIIAYDFTIGYSTLNSCGCENVGTAFRFINTGATINGCWARNVQGNRITDIQFPDSFSGDQLICPDPPHVCTIQTPLTDTFPSEVIDAIRSNLTFNAFRATELHDSNEAPNFGQLCNQDNFKGNRQIEIQRAHACIRSLGSRLVFVNCRFEDFSGLGANPNIYNIIADEEIQWNGNDGSQITLYNTHVPSNGNEWRHFRIGGNRPRNSVVNTFNNNGATVTTRKHIHTHGACVTTTVPLGCIYGVNNNIALAPFVGVMSNGIAHLCHPAEFLDPESTPCTPWNGGNQNGQWQQGDIIYRTTPTPGGRVGWINVNFNDVTWRPFGVIAP